MKKVAMRDFFLEAFFAAVDATHATTLEVDSNMRGARDFHVIVDERSLGKVRVYESSFHLLLASSFWPRTLKENDRGEIWRHWNPGKEKINEVQAWLHVVILAAASNAEAYHAKETK